tara:strand:- start:1265 stop:2512 length:1248 start_codon:yes stop_codon:yes gene_type:complete
MTKLCLTRYLYEKEEVILSLLNSLLEKKDLNSCFYWISELHYSKINVTDILIQIYYDFYFLKNMNFESYFIKNIMDYHKTNDENIILLIIKHLFHSIHCPTLFLLRQQKPQKLSFRGKKPVWLSQFDDSYTLPFRSLFKDEIYWDTFNNISDDKLDDFYDKMKHFIVSIKKKKKCIFNNEKNEGLNKMISFLHLHNMHTIIKIILFAHCYTIIHKLTFEKKKLFIIKLTDEEIQLIHDWNDLDLIEKDKFGNRRLWKMLPTKRIYSVHEMNFAFNFIRRHSPDIIDDYYYHWEYLAYQCPLWKERFDFYNVTFNGKKIIFPNDDLFEEFHELYYFEPDEQSGETNNKAFPIIQYNSENNHSYCIIKSLACDHWLEYIYKTETSETSKSSESSESSSDYTFYLSLLKNLNSSYLIL